MGSAIENGYHDIAKELLRDHGAAIIRPLDLWIAARKDCVYVVQVYLQAAPDMESRKARCNELLSIIATDGIPGWEGLVAAVAEEDAYRPIKF